MVPPLTPTLANVSLQNKADNYFSRLVFFSSLMAQGPGEARHDIAAAPGPPNRSRRLPLQASRRRSTSAPPNPETPQAYATHSNFGFPRTPKTKGPKGVQSRIHLWGFWGFGYRKVHLFDGSIPTWRVGITAAVTTNPTGALEGGPWFSLEYDIAVPLLRDC
jgi:hypothetical protein